MPSPPAILALLVAIAGWFYLFYSSAAKKLHAVESPRINHRRAVLRRINGAAMLLLSTGFYAGFKLDEHRHPLLFLGIWSAVMGLLLVVLILGVIDLRLTARLRHKS